MFFILFIFFEVATPLKKEFWGAAVRLVEVMVHQQTWFLSSIPDTPGCTSYYSSVTYKWCESTMDGTRRGRNFGLLMINQHFICS